MEVNINSIGSLQIARFPTREKFPVLTMDQLVVVWDDSQEQDVDFEKPTDPPSGFHSISPNLPSVLDTEWNIRVKPQPVLAAPVEPAFETPPIKRTGVCQPKMIPKTLST